MKRGLLLAAIALLLLIPILACGQTPEFRSIEATSWGPAFGNEYDTTAFVNYARSCNLNAIIPEVRLRSDAYYISTIEPRGTGTAMAADYDPLEDMITKAHAVGMEVHPWVVTFRIWTTTGGPSSTLTPTHVWFTHGPGNTNPANDWTMYSDTGARFAETTSNLDPGHPGVEDYLTSVFMEMVNNYDVDGLNLDYIRYPGTGWGYNPVAVARFNAEYGRTGNPSSADTTWQEWRRDQISNLVKRLYLEIKAVKPWVKLNADVWNRATTGRDSYLQDWDKWMANHWIDFVHPMMYDGDTGTYHGYLDAAVGNQHGRHVYPLITANTSVTGSILPEIDLVRDHGFQGMGLYSYQSIPNLTALRDALVAGPYSTFVSPPGMPWLDTPTTGYIKGFVKNQNGNAVYPSTVTIVGPGTSTKNTGTGFYGFVDVAPGTVTVRATALGYDPIEVTTTVVAGQVSTVNITLQAESIPPTITNVGSANVQATNAQILWDTDESATSQVDYGLTTAYGTTTTEDMLLSTDHTVQLVNLAPNTTYHYRVRSYDAIRNVSVSTDRTFTTTAQDTPQQIIVDNTDLGCTFTGSWFTNSTASPQMYGTNYKYCSASGTKSVIWRPNVVSAGRYNVYAWWVEGTNRTNNAPYVVQWNGGSQTVPQNQQTNGGKWVLLVANVPFAVGTSGYVSLSNSGINPTNVIADAIKLESADSIAPTAPTGLTASATAVGQMSLSWTGSTDNIGVTGYKVYRNNALAATVTSNSHTDSGLNYNTQFSYYIKATDAAGNLSTASNTVTKYSLSRPPDATSVTCDKAVDTWQSDPTFTFTAVNGFGAAKIQYYRYAWNQNDTHSWTGFEAQWTSGNLTPQAMAGGSWYLHVKGYNANDIANGEYTYGPFKYDGSPAEISNLNDGKYTDAAGQLHASWTGSDPETSVAEYQYAIGTSPENITSVRGWTSTGTTASVTTTGLTLSANTKYYFGVKALNGGGVWSDPIISDGVTAATVVDSIRHAKNLGQDNAIILQNKVVSANFGTYFYICEDRDDLRFSAIRVEGTSAIEGDLTDVSGIIRKVNGERVIFEPKVSPETGPGTPDPVFITSKYVGGAALNLFTTGITEAPGLHNIGVLVTVIGKVQDPGAGYFMLNDGQSLVKISTAALTNVPAAGKFVKVTGIISTEESGGVVTPILLPRGNTDVPEPWYL